MLLTLLAPSSIIDERWHDMEFEAIIMHPSINQAEHTTYSYPARVPGPGMYLAWHEEWRQEGVNENPWRVGDPLRPVFLEGSSAELYSLGQGQARVDDVLLR